jgi:hypothetical protein
MPHAIEEVCGDPESLAAAQYRETRAPHGRPSPTPTHTNLPNGLQIRMRLRCVSLTSYGQRVAFGVTEHLKSIAKGRSSIACSFVAPAEQPNVKIGIIHSRGTEGLRARSTHT